MKKTFEQWKREVDAAILALCGLTADDLPDYGYADAYEDGKSPKATARAAIKAAGDF
jgi:hypothetical protein